MPFISDDSEWKWLNGRMPYDKRRFVVVRKLHVKPNTDPRCTLFSVDSIRQHSKQFGDIESIGILSGKETVAHVTFVRDRSAYLMQSQHDNFKKADRIQPFQVRPADTWEQPREYINPIPEGDVEQTSEIFKLNEDCLLHVFMFLDFGSLVELADVCKLFNRLLHQHCFPRIRKYKMSCGSKRVLAQTRRELLCIGHHITDLTFIAHCAYKKHMDGNIEILTWHEDIERTSRFLGIVAQNVGQNIRSAYLELVLNLDRVQTIAPILLNLESLEIVNKSDTKSDDIDWLPLCPNLIEFNVMDEMQTMICCKPWPSLRNLSMLNSYLGNTMKKIRIIQQNPQLTGLEIVLQSNDNHALYTTITQHLAGLEKLTIQSLDFAKDIASLGPLPHLYEINLRCIGGDNFNVVIDHLSILANLRKIGLFRILWIQRRNYEQSLVNLMKQLPLLEVLDLVGISMKKETFFDIVRFGKQLKMLRVHCCELDFTDDLIFRLVNVLKCYRLESDDALQLWLPILQDDKLDAAKYNEHTRYLQIKRYDY